MKIYEVQGQGLTLSLSLSLSYSVKIMNLRGFFLCVYKWNYGSLFLAILDAIIYGMS